MNRNDDTLSDAALDELERITAELRVLERRCRKRGLDEVGHMVGVAEESAKQMLRRHAQACETTPEGEEDIDDDRNCVIPFRIGA